MPTDHSYFLESVVEAYSDAQIARAESTPLTSEKTSPRAPQASERACSRCGTVTSAYGPRNKATCRPCLSKAVKGSSTQTLHFAEYTWIKSLSKTNKLYQSIGLK